MSKLAWISTCLARPPPRRCGVAPFPDLRGIERRKRIDRHGAPGTRIHINAAAASAPCRGSTAYVTISIGQQDGSAFPPFSCPSSSSFSSFCLLLLLHVPVVLVWPLPRSFRFKSRNAARSTWWTTMAIRRNDAVAHPIELCYMRQASDALVASCPVDDQAAIAQNKGALRGSAPMRRRSVTLRFRRKNLVCIVRFISDT